MVEQKAESQPGDIIELTEDKGVIKKIITKGDAGTDLPKEGQEVIVNYEGKLTDGNVFDSSFDKEPLKVLIGTG